MIKIESIEEFNQILKEDEQFYFLKHSLTCPVSQAAFEEYESHENSHGETKHYYLAVQEARPLSNHIAETFQVKHESPQAFIFDKENVKWHASHWKITNDSLTKAIEE